MSGKATDGMVTGKLVNARERGEVESREKGIVRLPGPKHKKHEKSKYMVTLPFCCIQRQDTKLRTLE